MGQKIDFLRVLILFIITVILPIAGLIGLLIVYLILHSIIDILIPRELILFAILFLSFFLCGGTISSAFLYRRYRSTYKAIPATEAMEKLEETIANFLIANKEKRFTTHMLLEHIAYTGNEKKFDAFLQRMVREKKLYHESEYSTDYYFITF
jgi:flagellar biosynthesis protein FliP